MGKSLGALCQARAKENIAREKSAFHAILVRLECAGKLAWGTKLNVCFAASTLNQNMMMMSVPMFSHFKMEVVKFFSSAQRRKADEGVRISHLDPNTRMNSKDEFMQGTNLFLMPVRGVGL